MPPNRRVCAITYNGIDGACAAAALLLRHPNAELRVSSAARIGATLAALARSRRRYADVHVCGLGTGGDRQETVKAVRALKRAGARVFWHCGRGYLDDRRDWFRTFCTPVFVSAASNTEAVARHRRVEDRDAARFISRLALHDPHVEGSAGKPSPLESDWLDLITWSILEYFKFEEWRALAETVRKLSRLEMDDEDRRALAVYRLSGDRHVLLGRSPAIRELRRLVRRCAAADEPVLITGESGTGKELVAHLVRDGSGRALESFVPVNCAMFRGNAGLANSILFGHVEGAFTGAVRDRKGKFLSADGGILFLDEIGELPLEVQAKLLRVLQDGAVEPEGADRPTTSVDVRVVAATNRDLPAMIRTGAFRDDLYHRLSTLVVEVPPLRERPEDIDVLAGEFFGALAGDRRPRRLKRADLRALRDYDWPGNVRQLQKVVKTAYHLGRPIAEAVAGESRLGRLRPPPAEATEAAPAGPASAGAVFPEEDAFVLPVTADEIRPVEDVKRVYAARAWELLDRNWSAAARALGISVNTLKSWLR